MAYLTPDTIPADTICRILFIPNSVDWLAQVTGALQELTFDYNWLEFGAVTPEDAAAAMVTMFDLFCFNQGVCRVLGEIIAYAGAESPDPKWLLCDGASLATADYPDLFTVIGTTYGSVDEDHFTLPDLRGRAISGSGTGPGLATVTPGLIYGEQEHTLTGSEMPTHNHVIGNVGDGLAVTPGELPVFIPNLLEPFTYTEVSGGSGAHNTIGPRLGMIYLIVALP